MTELDVGELSRRLEQIWAPVDEFQIRNNRPGGYEFLGLLAPKIFLLVHIRDPPVLFALYSQYRNGYRRTHLALQCEQGEVKMMLNHAKTKFVIEWLPFFLRGCWLSGCDIEATAHEKLEWMQGFTSEEIEAWNLKM